jgi:hypothetical protein
VVDVDVGVVLVLVGVVDVDVGVVLVLVGVVEVDVSVVVVPVNRRQSTTLFSINSSVILSGLKYYCFFKLHQMYELKMIINIWHLNALHKLADCAVIFITRTIIFYN